MPLHCAGVSRPPSGVGSPSVCAVRMLCVLTRPVSVSCAALHTMSHLWAMQAHCDSLSCAMQALRGAHLKAMQRFVARIAALCTHFVSRFFAPCTRSVTCSGVRCRRSVKCISQSACMTQ